MFLEDFHKHWKYTAYRVHARVKSDKKTECILYQKAFEHIFLIYSDRFATKKTEKFLVDEYLTSPDRVR